MRGVAGGLAAEFYNWKTLSGDPSGAAGTTLEFLAAQKASGGEPFITVNIRGTVDPDSGNRYSNTSLTQLTPLARDWLRYTNLLSGTADLNNSGETLVAGIAWRGKPNWPDPADRPLPKVRFWQIGNEPSGHAGLMPNNKPFLLSNDPDDYVHRYKTITTALRQEDESVKVGPVWSGQDIRGLPKTPTVRKLLESDSAIDFVHYQPYQHLEEVWPNEDAMSEVLADAQNFIRDKHHAPLHEALLAAKRDPNDILVGVSEYDPAGWESCSTLASLARGLGIADQILTFSSLGYQTAMLWNRASGRRVKWPALVVLTHLKSYLGDTYCGQKSTGPLRIHWTKDSKNGNRSVWIINTSNRETATLNLSLPEPIYPAWVISQLVRSDKSPNRLTDIVDARNPHLFQWSEFIALENHNAQNLEPLIVPPASLIHLYSGANVPSTPVATSDSSTNINPVSLSLPEEGTPKLLAAWRGHSTSNGWLKDSSGNNFHAKPIGEVLFLEKDHPAEFVLNGSGWLEVPNFPFLPFGTGHYLKIVFEFRTTSSAAVSILDRGSYLTGGPMREISIRVSGNGEIQCQTGLLARNFRLQGGSAGKSLNDGHWHRVEMTFSDNTCSVQIDGEAVANWQTDWNLCQSDTLLIGARKNARDGTVIFDQKFHGKLRNLEIWHGSTNQN